MSNIQWTDETWNPTVGCSRISQGCANCYAAEAAKSARLQQFAQYQKVKKWDGTIEFVASALLKPLGWRSPKKIFTCSMSDLFHEKALDEWRDRIFAVMALCQQHTFQVLTKRPEEMLRYLSDPSVGSRWAKCVDRIADEINLSPCIGHLTDELEASNGVMPNVWLGATVENQKMANKRIPLLLQIPAKVRFLSCEPLLEKMDISEFLKHESSDEQSKGTENFWVIVGGESGSDSRSCHIDWIRSLVNQCESANVPVFVKQLGGKAITNSPPEEVKTIGTHCRIRLKDRKGGNPDEWPEKMPREFPACWK